MDDEYMFSEKQSIRDSSRSLKKYGSTCSNKKLSPNETLIRHEIDKTDTLQGIALKYGCSTEQIRRANRLFASDSLFLRQHLLVPVDKTSPFYPKPDENNFQPANNTETQTATTVPATTACRDPRPSALPTRPYSIAGELLALPNADDSGHSGTSSSSSSSSSKQSKSLDSVAANVMTPEEENRKCMNEFLNKIDTTISESRKYVEKSKEMITSQSDDDLFVTRDIVQRRRNQQLNNSYKNNSRQATQSTTNHHTRHSSSGSTSDTAQLLNTTQTRLVQNSLKRLEKQQDEFFEL